MSSLNVFKVFVGNLPSNLTEPEVRKVLRDNRVEDTSILEILVRRQHAIVSFNEQSAADAIIDHLQGKRVMGRVIKVEPAVEDFRSLPKTLVYNCSADTTVDDIKDMISDFCSGWKYSVHKNRDSTYIIVVERQDQVHKLVERFTGLPLKDSRIKLEPTKQVPAVYGQDAEVRRSRGSGYFQSRLHHSELPLKMIIPNEFVGAIIGRKGEVVKGITQETGARVDILQNQSMGLKFEKVVLIEGAPDCASSACRRIMEIIARESTPASRQQGYDICLKLLAPNNLVGRVIGKGGSIIKSMMDESSTKIQVSNTEFEPYSPNDRIITIRGSIDGMCTAEWLVSNKIRSGIQEMGGLPPVLPVYDVIRRSRGYFHSRLNHSEFPLKMIIPNEFVGAIIGRKGEVVKGITQETGARVDILQDQTMGLKIEKVVVIEGAPDCASFACRRIMEIITRESTPASRQQGFDVCLKLLAPNNLVGRVIGKGGSIIKSMMNESQTKIQVSNTGFEPYSPNDRIITIRGSLDGMCTAEWLVSSKIRSGLQEEITGVGSPSLKMNLH